MNDLVEVRFDIYCKKCEYSDLREDKDPCNECLGEPANEDSQKPKYWKEKGK